MNEEVKIEMENGHVCQDNNATLRFRNCSHADMFGWPTTAWLRFLYVSIQFLNSKWLPCRVDAQLSREKGERFNSRLSVCLSEERKRVISSYVFSRLISALKQIKETLSIVCWLPKWWPSCWWGGGERERENALCILFYIRIQGRVTYDYI